MPKLDITYEKRLSARFEADIKKPCFYLNRSFVIKKLMIDEIDTDFVYKDVYFIRAYTLPKTGHLTLEYEIVLDGSAQTFFPYLKERTSDPFFILRLDSFYYPLLYEPFSEDFYDHVLNRYEEDIFDLAVTSTYPFKVDLFAFKDRYRGFWPTVLFGEHKSFLFDLNLDLSLPEIKKRPGQSLKS